MHWTLPHNDKLRTGVMQRRIPFLVTLCCSGLLLAACGSSGGSQPTTQTTANFGPTLTVPAATPQITPTTTAPAATHPAHTSSGSKAASSGATSSGSSGNSGGYSQPQASGSSSSKSGASTPPAAHTVTVVHRITVHRTVTRTRIVRVAPPPVPQGAFAPSTKPHVHLSAFRIANSSIGCKLGGGTARCDISTRSWTPPPQPASCTLDWGQGLSVGPTHAPAQFVCAGDTALNPSGPVVGNGVDNVIGSVTCQVRNVGVTCFDRAGHGFFIGRTGYTTF